MNNKLDLHIFDFDGTLFKSPEPNPNIWHSGLLGKIKGTPTEGGLGWFQETITLDHPYVPLQPNRDEWFNTDILNRALNSTKNPNNITCLLTGRTTLYEAIIHRIIQSVELKFNHIGLKPIHVASDGKKKESTFDFKKRFILDLIKSEGYLNQIQSITVYEDRINHVTMFKQFLATIPNIQAHEVVFVDEEPKYLKEDDEKNLINYLVEKNLQTAQLEVKADYTCIKLDQQSVDKLLSWFQLPKDWVIKTHHVTLNLGAYNPKVWLNPNLNDQLKNLKLNDDEEQPLINIAKLEIPESEKESLINDVSKQYPIGKEMKLQVTHIGISSNAIAVKVYGCLTANTIAHCTIAIHPNASAVDSNRIQNWYNLKAIARDNAGEIKNHTLESHNPVQLKEYELLMEEKQKQPQVSSPSKKTQILPPTSCIVNIPLFATEKHLEIYGVISEVGKIGIREQPGTPGKHTVKQSPGKKPDHKPFILESIGKHHKEATQQEISKFMTSTFKYINDNKAASQVDIENFVKNLK